MKFVLIGVVAFLLLNVVFASQLLNKGYFLYNNLSVGSGQSLFVGVNASSDVDLIVINSSQYSSFINGGSISTAYNNTVSTGVYQLDLNPGNYTVISEALRTTNLNVGSVAAPTKGGQMINLDNNYNYNFYLANYSQVQVILLSSADYANDPLTVNLSGTSTQINADSNLDTLNLSINRGGQTLALSSQSRMQMFIFINSTPELVNPLNDISQGNNYSIGVASYGLYNLSGRLYPYQVKTDEVVGVANITALSAYDLNPQNSSVNGASLQLNVGLNTYVNNKLRVLWLQDVIDFNSSSDQYYLVDNIWNNTDPAASFTGTELVGNGNFSLCSSCGYTNFYAYSYPAYYFNYAFPFKIKLIILENQTPQGSELNFGYQILENGTNGIGPEFFFDSVLVPGSSNTTLLTTPYYQTPGGKSSFGNYYDSELVFGGEADGANDYFNQLDSSLWIYYDHNGTLTPFPSLYTFGLSTAESATNLATISGLDGALVITGSPDYSADIFAPNALSLVAQYISNTSNYRTTSAPTTTQEQTNPFQVNNVSPAEISALELIAAIAIIFVIIVGFLLVRRH